jgi:peptidoglycan hydrolase-like protein with peptidoglycan-binding domain
MPTTIKLGDTGDDVKRLQRVFARMKVLGPGDVDGVFGPQTEQVVKDFQQSNGLVVDGVVGPITWSHYTHTARHHRRSRSDPSGRWWPCSRACLRAASVTPPEQARRARSRSTAGRGLRTELLAEGINQIQSVARLCAASW